MCNCQIQDIGLAQIYRDRDDVRHFCGMLDGLAFLPIPELHNAIIYLQQTVLVDVPELEQPLKYFDETYVSGTTKSIRRPSMAVQRVIVRLRRVPPLFPPETWNVHEATLLNVERTNNVCEGWNNAFAHVVGHDHPSIWVLLEAIQMDEAMAATDIIADARGQPPPKRVRRVTEDHQRRLHQLCTDLHNGRKSAVDVLKCLGHCIRLSSSLNRTELTEL